MSGPDSDACRRRFSTALRTTRSTSPTTVSDATSTSWREAGFTVIRVGESVWSTWEPEDGRFDLDWLQPVLDGAHARGISVVLGTPDLRDAAVARAASTPRSRASAAPGSASPGATARRSTSPTPPSGSTPSGSSARSSRATPTTRRSSATRSTTSPAIELFHNHGVFQRVRATACASSYGDVETLNREWGLVYWSHRLADWDDLWRPTATPSRQYDLAWRRFQAEPDDRVHRAGRPRIVREYARPDQFVTTCIAYEPPGDRRRPSSTRSLDVAAGNPYYAMQDAPRAAGAAGGGDLTSRAGRAPGPGRSTIQADLACSAPASEPFLVTETNAQSIGWSHSNYPAYDGQWRQAAWALVARGARDGRVLALAHAATSAPRPTGAGSSPTAASRAAATARSAHRRGTPSCRRRWSPTSSPTPTSRSLYSPESKWALEFQPPLPARGRTCPDRASYERIFDRLLRGAFDAGLQAAIVHAGRAPSGDPAELVDRQLRSWSCRRCTSPTTRMLDRLAAYAEAGGHLVVGFRTGYADHEARARPELSRVGGSGEAAGVRYNEYTNLAAPVPVRAAAGATARPARGSGGDRVGRRAGSRRARRPRCSTTTRTSVAGPR